MPWWPALLRRRTACDDLPDSFSQARPPCAMGGSRKSSQPSALNRQSQPLRRKARYSSPAPTAIRASTHGYP